MHAADTFLRTTRDPLRLALAATAFWLAVALLAGGVEFAVFKLQNQPVRFRDVLHAPLLAGLWWIPITVAAFALVRAAPVAGAVWLRGLAVHAVAAASTPFLLNLGYFTTDAALGRIDAADVGRATLLAGLRWFHINAGAYLGIVGVAHGLRSRRERRGSATRSPGPPASRSQGPLAAADPIAASTVGTEDAGEASDAPLRRIRVSVGKRTRFIDADTVHWIEGAGDYARVHCDDGEFLSNERLWSLSRALDGERFVRVHRSAIVNVDRIRELRHVSHGDYEVTLGSGATVRVSRRRRGALQALLRERSAID